MVFKRKNKVEVPKPAETELEETGANEVVEEVIKEEEKKLAPKENKEDQETYRFVEVPTQSVGVVLNNKTKEEFTELSGTLALLAVLLNKVEDIEKVLREVQEE